MVAIGIECIGEEGWEEEEEEDGRIGDGWQ